MAKITDGVSVTKENFRALEEELRDSLDLRSLVETRRVALALAIYAVRFMKENPTYAPGFIPIKQLPSGKYIQDPRAKIVFQNNKSLNRLPNFAKPEPAERVSTRRKLEV